MSFAFEDDWEDTENGVSYERTAENRQARKVWIRHVKRITGLCMRGHRHTLPTSRPVSPPARLPMPSTRLSSSLKLSSQETEEGKSAAREAAEEQAARSPRKGATRAQAAHDAPQAQRMRSEKQ